MESIAYHKCLSCSSIFADPEFLVRVDAGQVGNYQDDYWATEMAAATERCYGSTLVRVAETFYYTRRPIRKFIDIGTGSGQLDTSKNLLIEA